MNFENFLPPLLSSLVGGLVVEVCNIFFVRRDRVQAAQMAELKKRLDKHLEEDNPEKIGFELEQMRGDMRRLNDTFNRIRDQQATDTKEISGTLGEISGTLDGIKTWLTNQDRAIQAHITNRSIHGKG